MLIFASSTFANGSWTITPDEPATLPLALVGLGTLAVYAVLTGWRPNRKPLAMNNMSAFEDESMELETTLRRAA